MEILVVRHGQAGSKDRWRGDDRLRPLSPRGRAEAAALADMLAPLDPARIISSPFVRCVQTVEPLAARLGQEIETSPALTPDTGELAVTLLRELASDPGPVVICTHGATIEVLQRRLFGRPGAPSDGAGAREKGSVWVLRAAGGKFTSADYLPPVASARSRSA